MTLIVRMVPSPAAEAPRFDPRELEVADFLRAEYSRVVSTVHLVAGDRDAAVDAVQEALVTLLTVGDGDWPRNIAAWVTVVANNRARDAHRHNVVGRRIVDRLRPAPDEDPVDRVVRDLDVLAALATLPPRMRRICELYYLHDQPVFEIASALGIGTGTVKTQLHRARIALARQLATA